VQPGIKVVHTAEMSQLFRSKKHVYDLLKYEGQYYLPAFDDCTIDFLRDAFSGAKKVRNSSEVITSDIITCCSC
jgi:hypothetical protein